MQIIDIINNNLCINKEDICTFIKAHINKSSYNMYPIYYEGIRISETHIKKINNEYQNGRISKWEYLYILSFVESYLLLWDEDNELIDCISEKILVVENDNKLIR